MAGTATEAYARQLHEMDQDEYPAIKRREVSRQQLDAWNLAPRSVICHLCHLGSELAFRRNANSDPKSANLLRGGAQGRTDWMKVSISAAVLRVAPALTAP